MCVAVHEVGSELLKKIDAHLPARVSEGASHLAGNVSRFLTSVLTMSLQILSAIIPQFSRFASRVNGQVRTHVLPVLQPHLDRISDTARERLAPAAAWTEERFGGMYRELQERFEVETSQYSHLHIAMMAGAGCLVAFFVISRVISWLTTEPEQPASQRRAQFIRSLPGVRGMVERERAKAIAQVRQAAQCRACDERGGRQVARAGIARRCGGRSALATWRSLRR
jgi:hypothetical protein